jgi:hypothetical protein
MEITPHLFQSGERLLPPPAQAELRGIVRDLESVRFRLLGVQVSVPPAPAGAVPVSEEEQTDMRTEIRTVIHCVLRDWVASAIVDLRDIANGPLEPEEEDA